MNRRQAADLLADRIIGIAVQSHAKAGLSPTQLSRAVRVAQRLILERSVAKAKSAREVARILTECAADALQQVLNEGPELKS